MMTRALFSNSVNGFVMVRNIDRPIGLVALRELFDESVITDVYFALIFCKHSFIKEINFKLKS